MRSIEVYSFTEKCPKYDEIVGVIFENDIALCRMVNSAITEFKAIEVWTEGVRTSMELLTEDAQEIIDYVERRRDSIDCFDSSFEELLDESYRAEFMAKVSDALEFAKEVREGKKPSFFLEKLVEGHAVKDFYPDELIKHGWSWFYWR